MGGGDGATEGERGSVSEWVVETEQQKEKKKVKDRRLNKEMQISAQDCL